MILSFLHSFIHSFIHSFSSIHPSIHSFIHRQEKSDTTNDKKISYVFTISTSDSDKHAATAILEAYRTAGEVEQAEFIIVYDGTFYLTEAMKKVKTLISNIRRLFNADVKEINNEVANGYTKSVKSALELATGQYAVLLSNDVLVFPGWISLLLRTMLDYPGKVGMVGPLYLFATNGTIMQNGGFIYQGGVALDAYRNENFLTMPFSYARVVDYVSKSCMLFNRKLFLEFGLFDDRFDG